MSNKKNTTDVVKKQPSEINSQVKSTTLYYSLEVLKDNRLPKTAIDREFLQRLLDEWPEERASKYIASYYNGFRDIDPFVFVRLDAIKKVLEKHKNKSSDKSELTYFLEKIELYESEGKEWLMINGQHRTDVWTRAWAGEINFHESFPQIWDVELESYITPEAGSYWGDLTETNQRVLLKQEHFVVEVNDFESLDNLKDIVVFHNDGNGWNPHEKRIISPSFLARKFYQLNEDKDFVLIHKSVGSHQPYSQAKKGIALLLTQMFYSYLNSKDSTEWYNIPNIQDTTLDKLVSIESDMYSKHKLNSFVTLSKSIARGYSHWLRNKGTGGLKHTIATFRKYFVFRMVLDQKNHSLNSEKYKVNNEQDFCIKWVAQETNRMLEYNNMTDEGQVLWDKANKEGGFSRKKQTKLFKNNIKPKCYLWVSRGSSTGDDLKRVVKTQLNDFLKEYQSVYYAQGLVSKHNTASSTSMDNVVRNTAVAGTPLRKMNTDEMNKLTNGSRTHVGHKTSRANDGGYDFDNLGLEDAKYNQSHGKENV
jgi:hypothetical protein